MSQFVSIQTKYFKKRNDPLSVGLSEYNLNDLEP